MARPSAPWHPCDRESWADVGRVQAWADIAKARRSLHGYARTPHKEGLTRCSRGAHAALTRCCLQRRRVVVHARPDGLAHDAVRTGVPRGTPPPTSAPGLIELTPSHICAGTGLTPSHICAGTAWAHPHSHLRRGWARPFPHLNQDRARPRPHLRRDHVAHLGPSRRCTNKQTHRQQWRAL